MWELCIREIILSYSDYNKNIWPEWECFIKYDIDKLQKYSNKVPDNILDEVILSFPKNLSILKSNTITYDDYISADSVHNVPYIGNDYREKFKILSTDLHENSNSCQNFCAIHPKKLIEAFWVDDKVPLCLDWILSNKHKGHEISSLANGYNILNEEVRHLK